MAVYACLGNDYASVSDEAMALFRQLSKHGDEFCHEQVDAASANVDEALQAIASFYQAVITPSMYPGKRVVWLKNASFMGESVLGRSSQVQEALEDLLQLLLKMQNEEQLDILLSCSDISKVRSFYKKLAKFATISECNRMETGGEGWEGEAGKFVVQAARKYGLHFNAETLDLFVHRISESPASLVRELEKIDLFLGPEQREVDEQTVRCLVASGRAGIIFEISRALEKRHFDEALSLVDHQLERGESAISIMRAAMIPTLRKLYNACLLRSLCRARTTRANDLIKHLDERFHALLPLKKDGSVNSWALSKSLDALGNASEANMRKALQACYLADKALVTSGLDARVVLHELVARLSQCMGTRR